jgi:hypothetical protein
MDIAIQAELAEIGLAVEGDDELKGIFHLQASSTTGGTRDERYRRFTGEILRFAANWEVVGTTISDRDSAEVSFSLALDENSNELIIGVRDIIFRFDKLDGARVINGHKEGELFIRILRPRFAENEPAWAILADSSFYAKDNS